MDVDLDYVNNDLSKKTLCYMENELIQLQIQIYFVMEYQHLSIYIVSCCQVYSVLQHNNLSSLLTLKVTCAASAAPVIAAAVTLQRSQHSIHISILDRQKNDERNEMFPPQRFCLARHPSNAPRQ